MQLSSEFKISDEVWYFKNSVPTKSEIKEIHIKVAKTPRMNIIVKYLLMRDTVMIHEQNLFRTQQDLYYSLS